MATGHENWLTMESVLGAWESFQGDGIHGWQTQVMVFKEGEGRLLVDLWTSGKREKNRLRLFSSTLYYREPLGTQLKLEVKNAMGFVDILLLRPERDGTFWLGSGNLSTAGHIRFRRTETPKA